MTRPLPEGSVTTCETLDTTRIDVFDSARYEWKEVGGTVVFSHLEKIRAQGGNEKFDLVASKVNNAKNSMMAVLNRMFYTDGTGNGGKDMGGLALLIATTPTSGTVGGINRATFSFWRNRSNSGAGTAYSILRASMRTTYNECSRGAYDEQPEWFVTNATDFGGYEGTLVANERFTSKDKGEGGFKNDVLKFKGADVAFDEDCPAATMYCGNSRNLKYYYPRGGWMKVFEAVEPANQTAEVIRIACVGNLGTNNPRRLGVIYSIA